MPYLVYTFLLFFCCATPILSFAGLFFCKLLTMGSEAQFDATKLLVLVIFMVGLLCCIASFFTLVFML